MAKDFFELPDFLKRRESDEIPSPASATELFGPLSSQALDNVPLDRPMPAVKEILIRPPDFPATDESAGDLIDSSNQRNVPSPQSEAPGPSEFTRIMRSFRERSPDPPSSSTEARLTRQRPRIDSESPSRESHSFTELFNSFSEPIKGSSQAHHELSRDVLGSEPPSPVPVSGATFGPGGGTFTNFLQSMNQGPETLPADSKNDGAMASHSQSNGSQNLHREIAGDPELFSGRLNESTEHNVRVLRTPLIAETRSDAPPSDDVTKLFSAPQGGRGRQTVSPALPRSFTSTPVPGIDVGGLAAAKGIEADTATTEFENEVNRRLALRWSEQATLASGRFQRLLAVIVILNTCLLIALLTMVTYTFVRNR